MFGFLRNLLDDNAREIKKLSVIVDEINELEPEIEVLTDEELQDKTPFFKDLLSKGTTLDEILPEAFAVVREASRRVLGMRHYDVQLMGGMVLHQGNIAEMKTGEGKTLVATLPVYLNALTGRGVHVVTVNDYLARRDSEWMGEVYKFLGLSVGLVVHGLDWEERRKAYLADITYGTNNEFGFDYLRDNMALRPDQLVQRELHYAIVDEVDSILIDEARTPLIISGQVEKATERYYQFAQLVRRLKKEEDYTVDEKAHSAVLTEEGVARAENILKVGNLYDEENIETNHLLNQALKAQALMKRDRDYVVKDGEIIIVDEFTGRLMQGRRYSDGLHQAIEAKEGVRIERESQTLASITFQNYFRMFEKLAGMTGTAETEQEEFRKIYSLDVIVIPTHNPMIRDDGPDVIYKTEEAKLLAVVDEIEYRNQTGQPVLVGTISIERSELLSKLLKRKGLKHQVLNAKFHDKEAEIVAQAGRLKAITIATNMAGRGTDILLGGNPEFLASPELNRLEGKDDNDSGNERAAILERYKKVCRGEREQVLELGGLHIIGTERHESRRIDNQLRGRCGRQGDPGSTRFFVSLEDDLMRLFGSDNISSIMERLGMEEDVPIEHNLISKSIENAQKKVENRNFNMRKHVLEYDDVLNQQRELIYEQRRRVLTGENMKEHILEMVSATVDDGVETYAPEGVYPEEWDLEGLLAHAGNLFAPGHDFKVADLEDMEREELKKLLLDAALAAYEKREGELSPETLREVERMLLLRIVDQKWMEHLDAMDQLREGIGLRAYGQKDPLVEYKFEGYEMFENMIGAIREDIVRLIYRVDVVTKPQERQQNVTEGHHSASAFAGGGGEGAQKPQPVQRKHKKIGRNAPCPCGSGKKYKKCCGANK